MSSGFSFDADSKSGPPISPILSRFWHFTLITPSNLSLASKLQTVAPNLLHIQNYVLPSSSLLLHTWSLAVEEHFYLLLPCFLWFICRKSGSSNRLPQIPIAAGILIALCTALRCYQAFVVERALSPDRHVLMILTHWRMDSLFFGVLIAYLKEFHPQRLSKLTGSSFKRTSLLVAGLALVSPMFFLDSHLAVVKSFGLTSLYFGYGAILLSVVSSPVGVGWQGRFLGSKVTQILASIGVSSYSIYLWHLALGREPMFFLSHTGFLNSLPTSVGWWAFTLLYGSLAVFAGMAMGRLIETPSLLLREKLFPAKSALKQESKAEMSKPTYGSKAA